MLLYGLWLCCIVVDKCVYCFRFLWSCYLDTLSYGPMTAYTEMFQTDESLTSIGSWNSIDKSSQMGRRHDWRGQNESGESWHCRRHNVFLLAHGHI